VIDGQVLGNHGLAGDRLVADLVGFEMKTDVTHHRGARDRARRVIVSAMPSFSTII